MRSAARVVVGAVGVEHLQCYGFAGEEAVGLDAHRGSGRVIVVVGPNFRGIEQRAQVDPSAVVVLSSGDQDFAITLQVGGGGAVAREFVGGQRFRALVGEVEQACSGRADDERLVVRQRHSG